MSKLNLLDWCGEFMDWLDHTTLRGPERADAIREWLDRIVAAAKEEVGERLILAERKACAEAAKHLFDEDAGREGDLVCAAETCSDAILARTVTAAELLEESK